MSLLRVASLTVCARREGESLPIISGLDFELAPGRILGLIGESGAGKSMIGRTIARLLPPNVSVTEGTIAFDGQDLVKMPRSRHRALLGREIAFIPQEPLTALNPVLTIGRQVDEHLARIGRGGRAERRTAALEMFDAVGLRDGAALLAKYPHQLSGGMLQRVLIAMAFSSQPRLVVADEPTTALDVTIQAKVVQLIADMRARFNTALIFISHDLRLAAQICDQMLVLYAGRAIESGPAKGVFGAPTHPYTRCLQLANPPLEGPRRPLYAMPERMPGLVELKGLTGCRFAPRCPRAVDACLAAEPALVATAPDQAARCIRPETTGGITAGGLALPPRARIAVGTPLLIAQKVSKDYLGRGRLFGRRPVFSAVSQASFEIRENEFVGVVGESGSGKSTLAKLAIGLETASSGHMIVAGQDVRDQSEAVRRARLKTVQMVFQDPQSALNPRRRVVNLVTQAMEAGDRRSSDAVRLARAHELLAEVGLSEEMAERFPSQLSGGQKQRINIARALCITPKLLVADEIVSGLDVSVQAQLLNLLLRLRSELDFALLFISHDLSVVRYLCDRVLVMYRGEIVESGYTEDVFANPRHDYTRTLLAAAPPDRADEAWKPLDAPVAPAALTAG
jgi:peptide/nickel transport system ATP-binding protein